MNIDDLTVGELKQISSLVKCEQGGHPFTIGQSYLVRCVTHYYVGRLIAVGPMELTLENASWVADTGRFGECLKKGTLSEVENMPGSVIVGRGAIIDAVHWTHDLPTVSK